MSSREKQPQPSLAPACVTSLCLHQLLDISSEALVVVDQAGLIMMTNERLAVLFAYTREELIGQPLEVLLPQHLQAIHVTYRDHYFMAPQTRSMGAGLQLFGRRKNGTMLPLDIRLKPILLDDALLVIGTVRDRTEQKRLEEDAAKGSAEGQALSTMNTILSATTEFVYLIDKDGRYLFASERAAELLDLQQSDFLGKTWQELDLPPDFMAPFEAKRQHVMQTGQTIIDEILFPVARGMRWFEYVVHPTIDQDGEAPIIAVTAHVSVADQERALAVGCSLHMGKPFKTKVLLQSITDLLATRGSKHET